MPTPYLLIASHHHQAQALAFASEHQLEPSQPPHPDLLIMNGEGEGLPIEAVREMKSNLVYRPLQEKTRLVVLCNLETASIPAQNALLKTLEEPPEYLNVILVTNSLNKILPTIQSRCQVVQLEAETADLSQLQPLIKQLEQGSVSNKIELAEKYKDREEGIALVDQLIHYYSQSATGDQRLRNLNQLLKAKDYLQHNTNPQLTMENLFLHF